jgi:hypothetical protein
MRLQQRPVPGYWYSNLAGQLIQVRAILYRSGKRARIVVEDIHGTRIHVDPSGWCDMDLMLHSPVVEQRHAMRDY